MRLLLSILFLSGFWCTQSVDAASAEGHPAHHEHGWKPKGPLLDVLRYTSASDTYHPDATMEDYFARMDREDKPRVLIVGCGHYDKDVKGWEPEGDHIHPDAWCVDIEDPNKFDPRILIYKKEGYIPDYKDLLKRIKANDCLDITTIWLPEKYVGKFDIVVLERIWPKPLSNPYTYYNAAQALKPEGYLCIEFGPGYGVGDGYSLNISEFAVNILKVIKPTLEDDINRWIAAIPRSAAQFPGAEDDSDNQEAIEIAMEHCASIYGGKTLGVSFSLSNEGSAPELDFFLRYLFFEAVAATCYMNSPFSGRGTSFVLAKKTALTQELLKSYTADEVRTANLDRSNEYSELPWQSALPVADHRTAKIARLSITYNPLLDAIRAVYPHGKD
jgi:hypothetical protein